MHSDGRSQAVANRPEADAPPNDRHSPEVDVSLKVSLRNEALSPDAGGKLLLCEVHAGE